MSEFEFSDLRKIEKEEKRQEDLSDLDEMFLLRVGNYLDELEDTDSREYKNAKRVFNKIIAMREKKVFKNVKIAVQSELNPDNINLLPREEKLFRSMKEIFEDHRESIENEINGGHVEIDEVKPDEEDEEGIEEPDDDYEEVKIVSKIPEFMGTDLESYGPFEEGEKAEIPEENAEILVNRGSAERVEG